MTSSQGQDTRPLLEARATRVAPWEATAPVVDPTAAFIASLPTCDDPRVVLGELCVPISSRVLACRTNEQEAVRELALPYLKQDEHEGDARVHLVAVTRLTLAIAAH